MGRDATAGENGPDAGFVTRDGTTVAWRIRAITGAGLG
jgi:hypothetical protein